MPNYCDNKLEVKGKKEDIELFLNSFYDYINSCFSMKLLMPVFDSNERRNKWGTSRDINCPSSLEEKEAELNASNFVDTLSFEYETAWTPNEAFVTSISRIFDNLEFTLKYHECGMQFVGKIIYNNGKELENEYIESDCGKNEKEYYSLAIDLGFESLDYVLNEIDLNKDTFVYLSRKYNGNTIDLTNILKDRLLYPEPE